ncbi:metallopeptidase family M12-like protein [Micromonospora sp. Llam0]|uniref:M12 family metallo-peptidase n=1 Tax=Micromonospora sp. Llam0 TaxID=2485143 RepID=UPI000F96284C|nr:M12 family metallo-peptidase [Micromonospora sp. Llam0]ROO62153.1 metallopeptidase family M12-like protein [Micromonospora sp. Llam0]
MRKPSTRRHSSPNSRPQPPPGTGRSGNRRLVALLVAVVAAALLPAVGPTTAASAAPQEGTPIAGTPWAVLDDVPTASRSGRAPDIQAHRFAAYTLDREVIAAQLDRAPDESDRAAATAPLVLAVPDPDGAVQRFAVVDSPVMQDGLAARHPDIRTYAGTGVDDPTATIRADLTPLGFHASVRSSAGSWYVDPYHRDQTVYASYHAGDLVNRHGPLTERGDVDAGAEQIGAEIDQAQADDPAGSLVKLRTYRLAFLTDPSYADYFGAANVTAAKVTLVNRVTQIYEDETAIRLVLISDTDKTNLNTVAAATGPDGPCGSAPCFSEAQLTGCSGATLNRNRIVLGQLVGASSYDVGHIGFGLPGGGVAGLGVAGGDGKARGCTGLPNPIGDFYAVDYVAHEIGHQFAGNHTFNGTQWNCSGGNRSATNSYEPGSGSSIMAYAGICQQDNLQPHTDPYWSQRSYHEITTFVNSTRPAINEVQTVSLRGFDTDGDAFTIAYDGQSSAPIVRGVNYTTAGIEAAIEALTGWPAGATVSVAAFGGVGALTDAGFQVTFDGGAVARTNVLPLGLADLDGAAGFVGETAKGGPVDNGGWRVAETTNHAPVVTVPDQFTVPVRTPFALTGSATDADGDALTYLWEQNDRGGIAGVSNAGTALTDNVKTNGPLFRVFGTAALVGPDDTEQYYSPGLNVVDDDPTRVFPDMAQILAGNTNAVTGACPAAPAPPASGSASNLPQALVDCYSEFLPTADWVGYDNDRTMHFKLTARDGRIGGGGVGSAETTLVLAPQAGPFLVTSQSEPSFYLGDSRQEITWDVAGTDAAPVNAAQVRISLSTDGAKTFPYVLAEAVPNDGRAVVRMPNIDTTTGRIRIEAVGNVFFDVNDADIRIDRVRPARYSIYDGDTLVHPAPGADEAAVLLRTIVAVDEGDVRGTRVSFTSGDTALCHAEVRSAVHDSDSDTIIGSASCEATLPIGEHVVTNTLSGRYTGSSSSTMTVAPTTGWSVDGVGYLRSPQTDGVYPLDPDHRLEFDFDGRFGNGGNLAGKVLVGYRSGDKRYKFQGSTLEALGFWSTAGIPQAYLRYQVTLYDLSTPQQPVPVATDLTLQMEVSDAGYGRQDSIAITIWDGDLLMFSSWWTGHGSNRREPTGAPGNIVIG